MDLPGVSIADTNDSSMFSLSTINKQKVKIVETLWAGVIKSLYVDLCLFCADIVS